MLPGFLADVFPGNDLPAPWLRPALQAVGGIVSGWAAKDRGLDDAREEIVGTVARTARDAGVTQSAAALRDLKFVVGRNLWTRVSPNSTPIKRLPAGRPRKDDEARAVKDCISEHATPVAGPPRKRQRILASLDSSKAELFRTCQTKNPNGLKRSETA